MVRKSLVAACSAGLLLWSAAAPAAAADPGPMDGDYRVRVDGSDYGVWTFVSDCDATGACTAQVESRAKGWTATAALSDGRWTLNRTSATLFGCGDGSSSPGEMRAKWDADTLSGSLLLVPAGKRCGDSGAALRGALVLTKA